MAESRRIRLTKRMIREAFLDLLQQQPLGKITVTQICDAADVNRSTFYAYYPSIYDLLDDIEDQMINKIPKPSKAFTASTTKEYQAELEDFFSYIKKHRETFSVLLSNAETGKFRQRLVDTFFDVMLTQDILKQSFSSRLGYIFCVNGVIGMLKEWIDQDFPMDTATFARIALQMSLHANDVVYALETRR